MSRKNTYETHIQLGERGTFTGAMLIGFDEAFVDRYARNELSYSQSRAGTDWDLAQAISQDLAHKLEVHGLSAEQAEYTIRCDDDPDHVFESDYVGENFSYMTNDFAVEFFAEPCFEECGGFTCIADIIAERIVQESKTRRWDFDGGCLLSDIAA